jgi:hypothetical protein
MQRNPKKVALNIENLENICRRIRTGQHVVLIEQLGAGAEDVFSRPPWDVSFEV